MSLLLGLVWAQSGSSGSTVLHHLTIPPPPPSTCQMDLHWIKKYFRARNQLIYIRNLTATLGEIKRWKLCVFLIENALYWRFLFWTVRRLQKVGCLQLFFYDTNKIICLFDKYFWREGTKAWLIYSQYDGYYNKYCTVNFEEHHLPVC